MKQFEYVYFTIYHFYSKRSYFPDCLTVRLKSMYLLAMSVAGWILLFQLFFLRFIKNAWFSSHQGAMFFAMTVYAGILLLFHYHFITKEVDQKIFQKYQNAWKKNPNKTRDLLLALAVAVIPYTIMVAVRVWFPRGLY